MPSGIERYQMKLTDRLQHLRQSVATRECTEVSKISLFFNDYAIAEDDTVKSLGQFTVYYSISLKSLSEVSLDNKRPYVHTLCWQLSRIT